MSIIDGLMGLWFTEWTWKKVLAVVLLSAMMVFILSRPKPEKPQKPEPHRDGIVSRYLKHKYPEGIEKAHPWLFPEKDKGAP